MASEIASYVANVGMSMLFGLGYYLVKKKKTQKPQSNSDESEKDLALICSNSKLHEIHALIKEKKFESDQYEILNILIRKGIKPSTETYNILLSSAYQEKNITTAKRLREELLQNLEHHPENIGKINEKTLETKSMFSDILPDSTSLSLMIKGLGIEYSGILSTERENNCGLGEMGENTGYYTELSIEKKQQFDLELRSLVSKFSLNKIELDLSCHNNLINSLVETNRVEEAWKHYRYLIGLSREESNEDESKTITKLTPDDTTYIYLIKGVKRLASNDMKKIFIKKVKNFFTECDYLQDFPNYSTLLLNLVDLLVKSCLFTPTAEEDMKEIETLLYSNESKIKKLEILENAYACLINGFAKLKDLNGAMRVFENLKKSFAQKVEDLNNEKSKKEENAIRSACLERIFEKECFGEDKGKETIKETNSKRKLSAYSYASVLNACTRTKNMEVAEILLEEMKSQEIQPNQYVYATIINGYKKVYNFHAALRLYIKVREDSFDAEASEDLKLSTVIFNSILDCCVGCGEFDQMQMIFNYLADLGNSRNFISEKCSVSSVMSQKTKIKKVIVPDLISYSILIKGYAKANDLEKVMEVYSYLKDNFDVDEVLYNTLLDSFVVNNNEEALLKIYQEMKSMGVKPSVVTYGILIKLYTNQKNLTKATEAFYEMLSKGITPSIIIYQLLIKLNSKLGKYEECMSLYRKLSDSSVKPDCMLTDFMVDLFCKNFMIDEATKVCEMALEGYTKELKRQMSLYKKSLLSSEKIDDKRSNSKFLLGLSNTYVVLHTNNDKEREEEFITDDDQLVNSKANEKILNFNFDNNSTTAMLDLGTIEFFIWGVIEEQDLMYLDKKIIIERLNQKIKPLFDLILPYTLGAGTDGKAQKMSQINGKICDIFEGLQGNTIYGGNFDDSKSISTIVTSTMNNNGNLSYKLVDLVFKLKKDTDMFLTNSAYDKSKTFNRHKNAHYKNNTNYQERIVSTSRQYYDRQRLANNTYYKNNNYYGNNNQELEYFNTEDHCLDFNDTASQNTFTSQFKMRPCPNYFSKKKEDAVSTNKKINNVDLLFENEDVEEAVDTIKNNNNISKLAEKEDKDICIDKLKINDDLKSEIDFDDEASIFEDDTNVKPKQNNKEIILDKNIKNDNFRWDIKENNNYNKNTFNSTYNNQYNNYNKYNNTNNYTSNKNNDTYKTKLPYNNNYNSNSTVENKFDKNNLNIFGNKNINNNNFNNNTITPRQSNLDNKLYVNNESNEKGNLNQHSYRRYDNLNTNLENQKNKFNNSNQQFNNYNTNYTNTYVSNTGKKSTANLYSKNSKSIYG